jgi:hypothetical protein
MLAVQHRLVLVRPRTRSVRRTFRPSQDTGPYRLPHDVRDRLASSLAPFRNRDAAFALARFLARYHSNRDRVLGVFMIDRRALADRPGLDLTEARVRGAIRTLEEIGYLERAIPASGSRYKPTPDGLHRKPVAFVFGPDYAPGFIAANKRAVAARERVSRERRTIPAPTAPWPSTVVLQAQKINSPKDRSEASPVVYMGEKTPPQTVEPNTNLEAALERLRQAIGTAGAKREGSG